MYRRVSNTIRISTNKNYKNKCVNKNCSNPNTGGAYCRPNIAEFANIAEKTVRNDCVAISRFLAKFLPVPILPKEPISPKLRGRLRFLSQITMTAS